MKRIFKLVCIALGVLYFLVMTLPITDGILRWIVGVPKQESLEKTSGILVSATECPRGKHPGISFVVESPGGKKTFSISCSKGDRRSTALQREIGQATVVLYRRPPSLAAHWESLEPDEIWDLKTTTTHHIDYLDRARRADKYSGIFGLISAALAVFLAVVIKNVISPSDWILRIREANRLKQMGGNG